MTKPFSVQENAKKMLVSRAGGIVTLTINRPEKRNALDFAMWSYLKAVFSQVAENADHRVLIIAGQSGAFCSGADLGEADPGVHPLDGMRTIGDIALTLHRLAKPTIAVVDGVAAGAGANLALGADFVLATERASFSQVFVKRGLAVDFGGSWLLPRLVGIRRAKELVLTGRTVGAEEAARIGLATRLVPSAEIADVTAELARSLAEGPPIALRLSKALLDDSFARSFEEAVNAEAVAQSIALQSADAAEARDAFLQRRNPRFLGR